MRVRRRINTEFFTRRTPLDRARVIHRLRTPLDHHASHMNPPATKRPRSDDPPSPDPPSLPYLPPELLGKILAHAHLPYNRAKMDELGLNRDQRAYANLALRQIEEEYSPMVQVVKDTLARLQTCLLETEGDNNRFQPHDANSTHPVRLMTCWPRRWYFEDVTDASELRDQILGADGSLMNADMCRAAAGPLEYCYSTPRHGNDYEQDAKLLTMWVPHHKLPRGVTSARLSLSECLRDHYDNFEGEVDTLERTFCLDVRFVGGDQYTISTYAKKSRDPDHYILRPEWAETQRYGAAAAPLQADREKKGPCGPHASTVSLIVRQLLLMEQTRPFVYFGVGSLCSDWRRELVAAGVHRLGLPDLMSG